MKKEKERGGRSRSICRASLLLAFAAAARSDSRESRPNHLRERVSVFRHEIFRWPGRRPANVRTRIELQTENDERAATAPGWLFLRKILELFPDLNRRQKNDTCQPI